MGGKSGGKIKIYEHFMSIHMGLCLYSDKLELLAVRCGDKQFWRSSGQRTRAVFGIVKANLFGGPSKEGGLKGMMWWLPGAPDQRLPAALYRRMGLTVDTHPGFRGFASLWFTGTTDPGDTPPETDPGEEPGYAALRADTQAKSPKTGGSGSQGFYWCANNPYLKPVKVQLRRASEGPRPDLALIRIENDSNGNPRYASNPAHMIYECLTSRQFGAAQSPDSMDEASYIAAAQTLYDEGFGLCVKWTRQSKIEDFINEILDHIKGVQYLNPVTGKHTLSLFRGGYNKDNLPEINPSNGKNARFKRRTWAECTNEIVVQFTDSEAGKSGSVTVQDLATMSIQGEPISDGRNYYMIPSRAIAVTAADRELAEAVTPLAIVDVEVTREFWDTSASHLFAFSWPSDGIERVIMRVAEMRKNPDSISLSLIEDIFATDQAHYLDSSGTSWQPERGQPEPPAIYRVGTAPAFMIADAMGLTDPGDLAAPEAMALITVAADSGNDIGYEIVGTSSDVNGTIAQDSLGTQSLNASWVTSGAIAAEAQTTLSTFVGLRGIRPARGDFVMIGTGTDAEVEIASVQSAGSSGILLNRGVLDTVPRAWPAGTRMWRVPRDSAVVDPTVRATGETPSYWFLMRVPGATLDIENASEVVATMSNRAHLPLRPADVKVNGVGFGPVNAAGAPNLTLTWATRNRASESTQVLKWTDAAVTGESSQVTVVRVLTPVGVVLSSNDVSGSGTTISLPISGAGNSVIVEVGAKRGSLLSLQAHRIEVNLV